jgi:hypothetical protein
MTKQLLSGEDLPHSSGFKICKPETAIFKNREAVFIARGEGARG